MRRLHPSLNPIRSKHWKHLPRTAVLLRTFASTAPPGYPRRSTLSSDETSISQPAHPDPHPAFSPSGRHDEPESLAAAAVRIISPQAHPSSVAADLRPLVTHLTTSFLPSNQPGSSLATVGDLHVQQMITSIPLRRGVHHIEIPVSSPSEPKDVDLSGVPEEPVVSVVSPFEGGELYNDEAVERAASILGAEIVKVDLPLTIGLQTPLESYGQSSMSDGTLHF